MIYDVDARKEFFLSCPFAQCNESIKRKFRHKDFSVINQRLRSERKLIGTNCLPCVMFDDEFAEVVANLSD